MDVVIRIASGLLLLLSVAALVLAILFVRRETRIVIRRDVVRLIIAAATVLVMNAVLDIATPAWTIALAIVLGGGLGVLQGRQLTVRTEGDRMYAQRTVWGVAAWGTGTVLLQLAGVINRAGLANIGLAAGFFGAATVAGMLVGRNLAVNEARRSVTPATAVLLVLALGAGSGLADSGQEHDIRDVFKGDVTDVSVQIRGTGSYYGDSIRLDITNRSGRTVWVRVPAGLKLVPGNSGAQTMITAGGEVVEVPPTPGEPQTDYIKAFCGEMNDSIPSSSEVFTPGDLVDDQMLRTIERIQDGNLYDFNGQEAVWHLTDGADISTNELVRQLIAPPTEIPAEDAIRLSLAGLTGTALLLANALVNAGHSVDDVLTAWRSGGLRDLLDSSAVSTSTPDEYVYRDPFEEANNRERVRSIIERLPPDQTRRDAEAELIDRLRNEEDQRAIDRIRRAIGPVGPDTDINELLRDNKDVDQVLDQLPDDMRRRLVETLHQDLEQERLRSAVDVGMEVLDRERRVEVLIDARNDPNQGRF
nr:hypothetical protein [Acidimicrobiia bacterium]